MSTQNNPVPADEEGARQNSRQKQAETRRAESAERTWQREQAALSVMHPDPTDPDWRHYHGAWGG